MESMKFLQHNINQSEKGTEVQNVGGTVPNRKERIGFPQHINPSKTEIKIGGPKS